MSVRSSAQLLLLSLVVSLAAGCNMPAAEETITSSPGTTEMYETLSARLTQAVTAGLPSEITTSPTTAILSSPPSVTITSLPSITPQPGEPARTAQAQEACDQAGAASPIDVTVPDDTAMEPGQSFTKIWRLQNMGDCTWTTQYQVVFFSGDLLGAQEKMPLSGQVSPGESVEIAIDMLAPTRAGTFQGNWKLRNPTGMAFGIGPSGSAPFWVRIVVEVTPTPTASRTLTPTLITPQATLTPDPNITPSATPATPASPGTPGTPSPSATLTPAPSLSLTLDPGDSLDLDSGEVNSLTGQDVLYGSSPDGLHRISPQSGALLALYGDQPPTRSECEAAELDSASLVAMNLIQRYLCYRTDLGLPGWAYLQEINPNTYTSRLEFLTWTGP